MVNEFEIKKQICDIGRRIYNRNMVAANDGNISVKLNDNEFLCTPTGGSFQPLGFVKKNLSDSISKKYFSIR